MKPLRELRFLVLLLIPLWGNSAFPGSHERWVEWDALEAGKLYMIRTTVHAQASYRTQRLGVWRFPGGGMFKVYERLFHDGVLWYRAKWIKPETIGDRHDILGWTKAAGLRGHGAYELR